MAVLTWQNVSAPNLDASQEGIRTAAHLLNQAAQNGRDITQNMMAAEAAQKAAAQAEADRVLADKLYSTQSSQALAQMLGQGTQGLLQLGIARENANPDMLAKISARVQDMQKQEQTKRAQEFSALSAPVFNEAAQLATKNLNQGLALWGEKFKQLPGGTLKDSEDAVQRLKNLYGSLGEHTAQSRFNMDSRNDALEREMARQANIAANIGIQNPVAFQAWQDSLRNDPKIDPRILPGALKVLNEREKQALADYTAASATYGGAALLSPNLGEIKPAKSSKAGKKSSAAAASDMAGMTVPDTALSNEFGPTIINYEDKLKQAKELTAAQLDPLGQLLLKGQGNTKSDSFTAARELIGQLKNPDGSVNGSGSSGSGKSGKSLSPDEQALARNLQTKIDLMVKGTIDPATKKPKLTPTSAALLLRDYVVAEPAKGLGIVDRMVGKVKGIDSYKIDVEDSLLLNQAKELVAYKDSSMAYKNAEQNLPMIEKISKLLKDTRKVDQKFAATSKTFEANREHAPDYTKQRDNLQTVLQGIGGYLDGLSGTGSTSSSMGRTAAMPVRNLPMAPDSGMYED